MSTPIGAILGGMFDLDAFVTDLIEANREPEPRGAIREVLARAVAPGSGIADALPPELAGIQPLHVSPELTVIKVVWAPGMTLYPHDHRMWAAIGIYTGGEDNTFFRRAGGTIVESGGKQLRPADVCLLGDDTVHAVTNPTTEFAGAVHVYGGDFFTMPRSEWDPETREERPFDVAAALAYFEDQNARFAG
jgi:predicted metal-dependent enzyme (double-stranded beta helix superfamily)